VAGGRFQDWKSGEIACLELPNSETRLSTVVLPLLHILPILMQLFQGIDISVIKGQRYLCRLQKSRYEFNVALAVLAVVRCSGINEFV